MPNDVGGSIHDVIAAVSRETRAETSQARLTAVFEHASDAIVLADDEGRYIAANPAAAAMLGHTRDELLGMSVTDVVARPVDEELYGRFRQVGSDRQELELLRADGELVTVEAVAVANVEPGVHLCIWRDLSETRRMLREVERMRARLATVVGGSQVGLLLVDPGDRVVLANPAARTILRTPDAEGRDLLDVLATLVPDVPDALVAGRRTAGQESLSRTVDDRWLRFHLDAVAGSGEWLVHVEDATSTITAEQALRDALRREQEAMEELVEVDRMKDTFMSAVSHELRTPLTAIRGLAETVQLHGDRLRPEQRSAFLDRLLHHSDRLESLLSDLLSLDRLRRGAGVLDVGRTDLRELLASTVANVDAEEHDITVSAPAQEVWVDRAKVERMVENLVTNAVRHTARGTRVEVRGVCAAGHTVIEVEDDGPGIPADLRDAVFDMFAKGSTGRARAEGTGVGLALVREFAELMGGTAELECGALSGALMRVTIPDRRAEAVR